VDSPYGFLGDRPLASNHLPDESAVFVPELATERSPTADLIG
jgi:hypothetical protein